MEALSDALLLSLVLTGWFHVSGCRLEQSEILEENQRNLLQITKRFFLAIINSSTEFPPQLRSVCHCLFQVHIRLHTSTVNSNPLHSL
jgi:neurofibromin 1